MSAPAKVTTNGVTPIGLGGNTGVVDETHTTGGVATTVFAVEDLGFEPKRVHRDTMDADEAITMRKSVTPTCAITMKGKVYSLSATGVIVQQPGTSITTTISGGSVALANFAASVNSFDPTAGLIILDSIKFSQKRLVTALEADLAFTHLPHAA